MLLSRLHNIRLEDIQTCSRNQISNGIPNAVSYVIFFLTSSSNFCHHANAISLVNICLLIFSFSNSHCICFSSKYRYNASLTLIDTNVGKTLGVRTLQGKILNANPDPTNELMLEKPCIFN